MITPSHSSFLLLLLCFLLVALSAAGASTVNVVASSGAAEKKPWRTSEQRLSNFESSLRKLYTQVQDQQWKEDKKAKIAPLEFGHVKGQYKNEIHINFVGDELLWALRRDLGIVDNNMFVTQFVLESLIKAHSYSPADVPLDDASVRDAVASSLTNKDKNFADDTPVFGFWPQKLVKHRYNNITSYTQFSINLEGISGEGESILDWLKRALDALKLGWLWEKLFKSIAGQIQGIFHTFNIPPDADDTSTMLAFAQDTLYNNRDELSESWGLWQRQGFNVSKAFDALLRYAYCPAAAPRRRQHSFKNGSVFAHEEALLDARSYFWAADFIQNLTSPDECVVTTWVQSFSEQLPYWEKKASPPLQPFNMNNIDPTVDSNALYAFVSVLLFGDDDAFFDKNPRMKKLLLTTARFVVFALERQPTQQRPDLEMLYYPPTVNIVFFASRVLNLLDSNPSRIKHAELHEVAALLRGALRNFNSGGTRFILQHVRWDGECLPSGVDEEESGEKHSIACWDGFLGANDTENNGTKRTPHHDDRFFTTAVAVNGLIDAWTVEVPAANSSDDAQKQKQKQLMFLESTPIEVVELVDAGADYLVRAHERADTLYFNAFFSGSVKSLSDIPFYFPANVIFDMNNKTYNYCHNNQTGNDAENPTLWGMLGAVAPSDYAKMVKDGCGGYPTMTQFGGWNVDWWPWPYWSSEPLSKGFAMLAVSKLRNILRE